MNLHNSQVGPNLEQRPKQASVYDVLRDELRFAQVGHNDPELATRLLNEQIIGIERLYIIQTKEYVGHNMLTHTMGEDVSALTGLSVDGHSEHYAHARPFAHKGMMLGIHANLRLIPQQARLTEQILEQHAGLIFEYDDDDHDLALMQMTDELGGVLNEIGRAYAELSPAEQKVLSDVADVASGGDTAQSMSFVRGFLFADIRMKEVVKWPYGPAQLL